MLNEDLSTSEYTEEQAAQQMEMWRQRQKKAASFLKMRGAEDLLPVLGLVSSD